MLQIVDLHVAYRKDDNLFHAVRGASLEVGERECVGIIGESGSGKSTLLKAILGLLPARSTVRRGSIRFESEELLALDEAALQKIRGKRIAIIPQDPGAALNPVLTGERHVSEILRAHASHTSSEERRREGQSLIQLLSSEETDHPSELPFRFPHQMSGGERQRVVVAEAVACRPTLLLADEPTSSLDWRLQEQALELLRKLRSELGFGLLLVTHDPFLLEGFADRVAVMYAGRFVEQGSVQDVLQTPKHPYTQALLRCAASLRSPRQRSGRFIEIVGGQPDTRERWKGCAFAPRCSHRISSCLQQAPTANGSEDSHPVECFLYD
jgi:peptide/nickel transport system ATP-binding protein